MRRSLSGAAGCNQSAASGVESAGRDGEGRGPESNVDRDAERSLSRGGDEVPSGPRGDAEGERRLADDRRPLVSHAAADDIRLRSAERHRLSGERAAAGGHLRDAQRQGDGEGRRGRDVPARRQAADDGRAEVRRAGPGRSPVARERSSVLGSQQRRASVDSPARSEQPAAEGLRRLELVSDRSGVSRRGHLHAVRRSRRSSTWRAWSATSTRRRYPAS